MAVGNTFGATALTSYGGFWIGLGIIFTPGGFEIASAYGGATTSFYTAVGFYLYVCCPSSFLVLLELPTDHQTTGLVHLHLHPLALDPPLHRRLLLPLPHRMAHLPHASYWLHVHHHRQRRHHTQPLSKPRRRCFRHRRGLYRLVEYVGWYCGQGQYFLFGAGVAFPLE
jgi:hypothetical protein